MPALEVNLLWMAASAVSGILVGRFLLTPKDPIETAASGEAKHSHDEQAPLERRLFQRAEEMMARLRELASSVADDVDQHTTRVQEISEQLNASQRQEDDVLTAIAHLIQANERMRRRLNFAEERLRQQARQIETHAIEARTDALTNLPNRRALDDEIARCRLEFEMSGRPFSLMLLDIDHFKQFNDAHGHQGGDSVLRQVARILQRNAEPGQMFARYGGEEFGLLFSTDSPTQAREHAEYVRKTIGEIPCRYGGVELQATASGGFATIEEGEATESLLRRADAALYAAKNSGRNRAYWHDGWQLRSINAPAEEEPVAGVLEQGEGRRGSLLEDGDDVTMRSPMWQRSLLASLPNRDQLGRLLEQRLGEREREGTPFSLLLVQIDDYEAISERCENKNAEVILRATAQFLRAATRSMDCVARFQDDTFALLVPAARLQAGVSIGERIRAAIQRCRLPDHYGHSRFTVSLGVAEAAAGDGVNDLIERVQAAVAAAADQGGNRTWLHDGEHCESAAPDKTPVAASE